MSWPNHLTKLSNESYKHFLAKAILFWILRDMNHDVSSEWKVPNGYIDLCDNTVTIKDTTYIYSAGIQMGSVLGDISINNVAVENLYNGFEITTEDGDKYNIDVEINNLSIKNMSHSGFYFEQNDGNFLIENSIIDNCSEGIGCIYGDGSYTIKNSKISNCSVGFNHRGKDKIFFYNNSIENCRSFGIASNSYDEPYIYSNQIKNNKVGISLGDDSKNVRIYKNYLLNNTQQARDTGSLNKWYLDYPDGGNYWSDYSGSDVKKGYSQDEDGSDGFGDTAYVIDSNSQDFYPIFIDTVSPTAFAGNDISIDEGTTYHFDSSGSTDDQLIQKAIWEFEYDGGLRKIDNLEFDFLFNIPGVYEVTLTVFDFYGNSDTDDLVITVLDTYNPIAVSQGDLTVPVDTTVTFNGSGSHDISGIKEYHWLFDYKDEDIHLTGPTPSFTFDKTGIFKVTLRVIDNHDHVGETTFNVTVPDNDPPIAYAGPDVTINNGEEVAFDGSGSTDKSNIVNYTWTFTEQGIDLILQGISPSYLFDIPGHYEVTLTVKDEFGNTATDSLKVTVVDTIPPVAVIRGSLVVLEGETLSLHGLNSTDNGWIDRYEWTFQDDSKRSILGPYLNYSFKRKGPIEVELTVYDQWNNSNSATVTVDVQDTTPPIANAGQDASIVEGSTFTFNGTGSTDNGIITRWVWSFEYDDRSINLEGEMVDFKFDVIGVYSVTLTVIDQSANIDDDLIIITVTPADTDDDENNNTTSEDNKDFPLVPFVLISFAALIVVVTIILLLLMRSKKKNKEDSIETESEPDEMEKELMGTTDNKTSSPEPLLDEEIHDNPRYLEM